MKWFKRFLLLVALILLSAFAWGTWKAKSNPQWYKPLAMDEEQIEVLSHEAVNQLNLVHNMADRSHALESAARKGVTRPTTVPAQTLRFTDEQLNALFLNLTGPDRQRIEKYFVDPQVRLEAGQIILAATVKDMGRVVSVHLEPRINDQGKLDLNLAAVYFGELPVPEVVLSGQIARVEGLLNNSLPEWQRSAKLNSSEGSNAAAVYAALGELGLDVFQHQPTSPILFGPYIDPVELTDVQVEDGAITLTVRPLTQAERESALDGIRQPRAGSKTQE